MNKKIEEQISRAVSDSKRLTLEQLAGIPVERIEAKDWDIRQKKSRKGSVYAFAAAAAAAVLINVWMRV